MKPLFATLDEAHAWARVAVEANKALDAYLRSVDPTLPPEYGMPVDGVRRVVAKLRAEEKQLSDAYVRVRCILGALKAPLAPTPEQIWEHTEAKAKEAMESRLDTVLATLRVIADAAYEGYSTGKLIELMRDKLHPDIGYGNALPAGALGLMNLVNAGHEKEEEEAAAVFGATQRDPTVEPFADLFTEDGKYITTVRLNEGKPPEAITYDGRVFVRRHGHYNEARTFAAPSACVTQAA